VQSERGEGEEAAGQFEADCGEDEAEEVEVEEG